MQHWGRSPASDAMGGGAGRTGRSATIGTEPPVAETMGATSEFLGWMRREGGIIPPSATNNCTPDLFGAGGAAAALLVNNGKSKPHSLAVHPKKLDWVSRSPCHQK